MKLWTQLGALAVAAVTLMPTTHCALQPPVDERTAVLRTDKSVIAGNDRGAVHRNTALPLFGGKDKMMLDTTDIDHRDEADFSFRFISGLVWSSANGEDALRLHRDQDLIAADPLPTLAFYRDEAPNSEHFMVLDEGDVVIPPEIREAMKNAFVIQFAVQGNKKYNGGVKCYQMRDDIRACRMHIGGQGVDEGYDVYELTALKKTLLDHFLPPTKPQVIIGNDGLTIGSEVTRTWSADTFKAILGEVMPGGVVADKTIDFNNDETFSIKKEIVLLSGASIKPAAKGKLGVSREAKALVETADSSMTFSEDRSTYVIKVTVGDESLTASLPISEKWKNAQVAQFSFHSRLPKSLTQLVVKNGDVTVIVEGKKLFISSASQTFSQLFEKGRMGKLTQYVKGKVGMPATRKTQGLTVAVVLIVIGAAGYYYWFVQSDVPHPSSEPTHDETGSHPPSDLPPAGSPDLDIGGPTVGPAHVPVPHVLPQTVPHPPHAAGNTVPMLEPVAEQASAMAALTSASLAFFVSAVLLI